MVLFFMQQMHSVERSYLFHCRNSEKNSFPTQNFSEIGQLAVELWPKNDFQHGCRPPFLIYFKNFHIWSRDCHRVPSLIVPNFIKIG